MEKEQIISNYNTILEKIKNACVKNNRNPDEVALLLATKSVAAEKIKIAVEAGAKIIGENKVQELKSKADGLSGLAIEKHFIGHLQTNKVKDVLEYATCIQSLDRINLAIELDKRLQKQARSIDVFIQVNTSYEESKFGLQPDEVIDFIRHVKKFETLRIKGLMTIGLLDAEKEKMRPSLSLLRLLREKIYNESISGIGNLKLSMGMSQDMEIAIAEGSDMVRIGTAVFGNRFLGKEIWKEDEAK